MKSFARLLLFVYEGQKAGTSKHMRQLFARDDESDFSVSYLRVIVFIQQRTYNIIDEFVFKIENINGESNCNENKRNFKDRPQEFEKEVQKLVTAHESILHPYQ